MAKFYFSSIFILFFSFGFSQNFSYLNASTANADEYPVDKDTNIYMCQADRLSKTDKNFNVIWSNIYNGRSFTNLLLSKTGSVYFLSGPVNSIVTSPVVANSFGKINPNGSLAWIKPISGLMATVSGSVYPGSGDCRNIYLDAGNNLIITGNMNGIGPSPNNSTSYILKCDTNGLPLKFKTFKLTYGQDLVILNDSAGVYKLLGTGPILSATLFMIHSYSDVTDNFVNYKSFGISWGSGPTATYWKFFRSKLRSSIFYVSARVTTTITDYNAVVKITDNAQVKWTAPLYSSGMSYYITNETMEEDNKGNVLASISCGGSCPSFTSAILKIDSNGVRDPFFITMLKGYAVGSSFPPQIPKHSPRTIYANNYYFDIWGYAFPNNPLTIQKFNSSMILPCGSAIPSGTNGVGASAVPILYTATIVPVSSFTLGTTSVTVSPSSFSVNPNFCTVLGINGIDISFNDNLIFPNPSNDKIYFRNEMEKVEVFDVNGKNIKNNFNASSMDVSDLQNGIYFIRVKTDRGEFNKKFIKE